SVGGSTASPVPSGLLPDRPKAVIPLEVTVSANGTSVLAPISFGTSGPLPFDVATGASTSAVASTLVAQRGLVTTGQSVAIPSLGCPMSAPVVSSGTWSIGAVALTPRNIAGAVSTTLSPSNAEGLVGSDVLSAYGSIVLDYRSANLFLVAG
ncbi:MAG: hypothetical protein ACLQPH_11830, partial [Acidimicrobiales bacterium]